MSKSFYLVLLCIASVRSVGYPPASHYLRIAGQQPDRINLEKYKSYFSGYLNLWTLQFKYFNLSEFYKSDSLKFEDLPTHEISELNEFYSIYKPLISFSKGGNEFIDIYSYQLNLSMNGNTMTANPEIDQEIDLCDLKKKKWNRILFRWIDDVIWISNKRFILVGLEQVEGKEMPLVYLGDTEARTFIIYESTNKNCLRKKVARYKSSVLSKLKIAGL